MSGAGDTAVGDPDAALVALAREGYLGAYEELVRRHSARAHILAVRMTGDRDGAHDITQDAFVQAWRALPGFDGRARFSTWLHRIVVNTSLNALRARRARLTVPLVDEAGVAHDPPAPERTEQVVEARHREQALYRALEVLPLEQRAPLVLTSLMDCSYAEAADVLDLPVATVRGRVARGRRTLVAAMREWE